jgi:hypothetical protein
MHIKEMIEATKYKITDGSEYLWACYGKTARFLDFEKTEAITASCVFDTKTQEIYEATLMINLVGYRWINPKYLENLKAEYIERDLDMSLCIDDIQFIDYTSKTDFLEKVKDNF